MVAGGLQFLAEALSAEMQLPALAGVFWKVQRGLWLGSVRICLASEVMGLEFDPGRGGGSNPGALTFIPTPHPPPERVGSPGPDS